MNDNWLVKQMKKLYKMLEEIVTELRALREVVEELQELLVEEE